MGVKINFICVEGSRFRFEWEVIKPVREGVTVAMWVEPPILVWLPLSMAE